MHVRDPVGIQIDDLVCGISDAGLFHGLGIAAEIIYDTLKTLGHKRTGQLDGPFHLFRVRDRHDARKDRYRDSGLPQLIKKIEKQIVVEDHLGRQKISPGFHLLFQEPDVLFLIRAVRMDLRITGSADTEITAFLQLPYQLDSMAVLPCTRIRSLQLRGQIAPQSHHVFNSSLLHFADLLMHGLPARGHACQMGQGRNLVFFFNILCDIQRKPAGSPAGTVSDAHKSRSAFCDRFGR